MRFKTSAQSVFYGTCGELSRSLFESANLTPYHVKANHSDATHDEDLSIMYLTFPNSFPAP